MKAPLFLQTRKYFFLQILTICCFLMAGNFADPVKPDSFGANECCIRGDLNLNGIPYEVADYILYWNYFLYGDAALSSDFLLRQMQIAYSDINGDARPLRVSDLVYMGRVITGDAWALPGASSTPEVNLADFQIVQETDRLLVSYNSPNDIDAIFLRLTFLGTAGEPVRLDTAQNMDYGSNIYPGELRFLLAPSLVSPSGKLPAGSGPLLSIPFSGNLRGVEIQASHDGFLELSFTGSYPIDQRGDLNANGSLTGSDVVLELRCLFNAPSPDCPLTSADLDCDGSVSAADVVNVINATFLLEPLPICNP